jgi:uncharacterized protein with HEPN domain
VTPGPDADRVLLLHMRECLARIDEYTQSKPEVFKNSRLVQDAVVRNLQTLTESSQRLSDDIKATEADTPWRELAGFRNVIVHGYLGIDLEAVWLVIERDLPPLSAALQRMTARLAPLTDRGGALRRRLSLGLEGRVLQQPRTRPGVFSGNTWAVDWGGGAGMRAQAPFAVAPVVDDSRGVDEATPAHLGSRPRAWAGERVPAPPPRQR